MLFQSAPSRGRRPPHGSFGRRGGIRFNPRLREEGDSDRAVPVLQHVVIRFNPRLREEGDSTKPMCRFSLSIIRFNPRLREEGDINTPDSVDLLGQFQSAPSRGRRHASVRGRRTRCVVSIRAFARKATWARAEGSRRCRVSIRAFARKATWTRSTSVDRRGSFQSAPSRGRRPGTVLGEHVAKREFQSAPSRGRRRSNSQE